MTKFNNLKVKRVKSNLKYTKSKLVKKKTTVKGKILKKPPSCRYCTERYNTKRHHAKRRHTKRHNAKKKQTKRHNVKKYLAKKCHISRHHMKRRLDVFRIQSCVSVAWILNSVI